MTTRKPRILFAGIGLVALAAVTPVGSAAAQVDTGARAAAAADRDDDDTDWGWIGLLGLAGLLGLRRPRDVVVHDTTRTTADPGVRR